MSVFAYLLPLLVIVPLLGAAGALVFAKQRRVQAAITIAALFLACCFGGVLMAATAVHGPLTMAIGGWQAPYGIVLLADPLAAMLVTTSALVLLAVLIFSLGQGLADGDDEAPVSIFYPSYLVLAAGVFDAFIAHDLFNLYVAFEILLVASYVLITMGGTAQRIRAGVTYIVVSLVSSVLFLTAIGLVYAALGTVSFADLAVKIANLDSGTQLLLNVLLLFAFLIKAAIFPFSFWLPDSYPTAPAPVTAVFAGLLTKVGIYAILRTQTLLFPEHVLQEPLLVLAGITLLVGILGAISQRDIKRLLSFTLLSHIGYLLFGVAVANELGYAATTYYIVHHIVVQTTMFLIVGLIERVSGSTSLDRLGNLASSHKLLAVLAFMTLLNLGGIPPFSGFLGKVGLFAAALPLKTPLAYTVIAVGALVSLLTLYALTRMWSVAFWRPISQKHKSASSPFLDRLVAAPNSLPQQRAKTLPWLMTGASIAMVAVCVLLTVCAPTLLHYAQLAAEYLNDSAKLLSWYDLQQLQLPKEGM